MFSKTIVRLKAAKDSKYPSDETIKERLLGLGFEILFKPDPVTGPLPQVKIESLPGHEGKIVDAGSVWHYRDRAYVNISKMGNSSVTREVELYGIYYGATSAFEASVAVSRVNQGEICIFVVQKKLDQCARCTEHVIEFLKKDKSGVFQLDDRNTTAVVQLFSSSSGANIASGKLVSRTFLGSLRSSTTETTIALFLLVLAFGTFLAGLLFPAYIDQNGNQVDPLTQTGRVFVERAWPASIIASITAFITLRLSFGRMSKEGVEWDWKL